VTTTYPRLYVRNEDYVKAAKEYAASVGHFGRKGGWIYWASGAPICHGWAEYAAFYQAQIRDYMTRKLTGFDSFKEMTERTHASYRPTILPRSWRERFLADAYDVAQERRGDPRRAWRGSGA
jgi:hypothetical protein